MSRLNGNGRVGSITRRISKLVLETAAKSQCDEAVAVQDAADAHLEAVNHQVSLHVEDAEAHICAQNDALERHIDRFLGKA